MTHEHASIIVGEDFPAPDRAAEEAMASITRATRAPSADDFSGVPPLDLFSDAPPHPFIEAMLPGVIWHWAIQHSRASGIDVTAYAIPGISAACAAMGDHHSLLVNAAAGYYEHPRLWTCTIARPGSGKSPGHSAAFRPIHAIDKVRREEHRQTELARRAAEAQTEQQPRRGRPRSATREDDALSSFVPLTTQNITIEAVAQRLAFTERGICYQVDELTSWFGMMGQYRSGSGAMARAEWCRTYDGGPANVLRVLRGECFVDNYSVSLCAATTPDGLRSIARSVEEDGLLQRLMLYGIRALSSPEDGFVADAVAVAAYGDLLDALYREPRRSCHLSARASILYGEECADIRHVQRAAEGAGPAFASHIAKHPAMLARVALAFHMIETSGEPMAVEISEDTMAMAAGFMRHMMRHSRWAWMSIIGSAASSEFKDVAGAILASTLRDFNRRALSQASRAFRDLDERGKETALAYLMDAGWIFPRGNPRAHGCRWITNPAAFDLYADWGRQHRERRRALAERFASEPGE